MAALYGSFVWYELMTTDTPTARAFYTSVTGWSAEETTIGGPLYTLFNVADVAVAGMIDLPREARTTATPPCWIGYIGTADVDASAALAERLGGSVQVPPRDIPNVGRFAVIRDPQGATLALFKWASESCGEAPALGTPGRFGWHELRAADWRTVFPFYADLFGWQKSTPVDMGPMGTYQLFAVGEHVAGGMMTKPPTDPVPAWLYYTNVDDIDAAVIRVQEGSGQVLTGPMQVPGGAWVIQCRDPQGAMFAMVGPRR